MDNSGLQAETSAIDLYMDLKARLKKRRMMAFITGILVFGILSLLSGQGILQTHWLTFLLLSAALGSSTLAFSRLCSWLFFLRLRLKNLSKQKMKAILILDIIKATRHALFIFCANMAVLIFSFFILIGQQPDADGTANTITFGNFIAFMALGPFLALMIFIVIGSFSAFVLRINLFPPSLNRPSDHSDFTFRDNHPLIDQPEGSEPDIDFIVQAQKNWDRDPMNPASPEYQSTYRRWWHLDE